MFCQSTVFVDMVSIIYDKVADEDVRHEIYIEIIQVVNDSRLIGTLESLKGIDPAFDQAFETVELNKED